MADTTTFLSPLPPTPPPAVYSQFQNRAQSPQTSTPPFDFQLPDAAQQQSTRPIRHSTAAMRSGDLPSPVWQPALVRVHSPANELLAETYGEAVGVQSLSTPEPSVQPLNNGKTLRQSRSNDRLSPAPYIHSRKHPLQERSTNAPEPPHRRAMSDGSPTLGDNQEFDTHENGAQEPQFQPLQYHHQILEDDRQAGIDKRASQLTVNTEVSGSPFRNEPDLRHSMYGRNLQRPDSGFSSSSEFRGRARSPQLSPNHQARATSAHSRSPDVRPLSYVDLLNVPYPQPAPSGAGFLVNAQLRASVGANAALLSRKKTLEMYRANVKKSSDPAVQYEFAILLINAARETNLEEDDLQSMDKSPKAEASTHDDFLREAKHILQRLAERSYPFAQYYLADGYASGLFSKGKEDHDRAFSLFLASSKHGHAEAGYRTALCYEFGWGCRVDAAKAVQFYQHAASKNHPGAMLRLGRACLMGDMGLGKRYKEGVRWLKRAAEKADGQYNSAPYELGVLHESGYGDDIFKDESYSAQLFTQSASLGHAEAAFRMGDAYEHGKLNCPRDPALSVHFYHAAAQAGHPVAQMALCAWYMTGAEPVLEKDEDEAYEWARKAAVQGFTKAQYTVGFFTEMGIGCRRDPLEANVWYVRAAESGDERTVHRLAAIRAAATGADPVTAAASNQKGALTPSKGGGNVGPGDEKSKKRFGIF